MAKSAIFRRLRSWLRDAKIAHKNKLSESQVSEQREKNLEAQSRREFMKNSAVTGSALAATSMFSPMRALAAATTPSDTVAILGAGAAGLAAAYALRQQGVPFHLYDASSRVGGRMWTARNFNADGQSTELGGELVDTGHTVLRAFVKLMLPAGSLQRYDKVDTSAFQEDIFYSTGIVHSHAQIINALQPFLDNVNEAIEDLWAEVDDDYLTYYSANATVRKYDNMSLKEFLYSPKMLNTVPRWILDFINVAYLSEYGRETEEQPSINLLYLIGTEIVDGEFELFGLSDEAFRIKGGSDALTTAISNAITDNGANAGQVLFLGKALTGIRSQGGKFYFCFNNSNTESRGYSQVICTIPFSVLSKVEGMEKLALSARKKLSLFGSATKQPFGMGRNSKVFATFKSRVWRSDSPTIKKNIGAFYGANDFKSQCIWESSRLQAGNRGILTNFVGGNLGLAVNDTHVNRMLTDLARLYPQIGGKFEANTKIIDSRIGNSKQSINWNKNKYTHGSYGCVMLGQWTTMVGALGEVELNNRMFFAGEHTSLDYQGYMEGGFESGMRAAYEVVATRNGKPQKDHYAWAAKVLKG